MRLLVELGSGRCWLPLHRDLNSGPGLRSLA